jgi:hypothetical protein
MDAASLVTYPSAVGGLAGGRLRWSRLGILIAFVLAGEALVAATIVATTGVSVAAEGLLSFCIIAAGMYALWAWCSMRRIDPRLGLAAATVGTGIVAIILSAIITNVGLRLGAPLIDARLAEVDALVGFDVSMVDRGVPEVPGLGAVLAFFYNASILAVPTLIAWLVMTNDLMKVREVTATIFMAMALVALCSVALPAVGAMAHFGLVDFAHQALPPGAGTYHLDQFARFRAGTEPVVRLPEMTGLVTFPSFHTVLALIATQTLAHTRLRWAGVAWSGTVIAATIPIGGHYVTDLAAGFFIWAACAWTARRFNTPSA